MYTCGGGDLDEALAEGVLEKRMEVEVGAARHRYDELGLLQVPVVLGREQRDHRLQVRFVRHAHILCTRKMCQLNNCFYFCILFVSAHF